MADQVGVGIVGTGLSATQHLTALRDVPNGRVVAVAGTSLEKARAFARKWEIPRPCAAAEELVGLAEVEVVHACVPPDQRLPIARLCARAGKHILLEKPMARSVAEADEILALCDGAGITVGAMFQNRFTPLAQKLKAAVEAGKLGQLLLVNVSAKWYRHAEYYQHSTWRGTAEREGGAVLINQAIHSIDMMRWICGPVAEVEGLIATQLHSIEMEDVGMALLRFADGAVGSIVATTVAWPGFSDRLELHGTRGSATLIQNEGRLEWYLPGEEPRVETAASQVSGGSRDPAATPSHGHIAELTDLYAAIRERRQPTIDGREGRHALEIVEAIYRSGRERRPVKLPLT
ncbi:MAG TPA: Gfo/Idh/MocA family oxidoreductase [Chloroflexota bacterium]